MSIKFRNEVPADYADNPAPHDYADKDFQVRVLGGRCETPCLVSWHLLRSAPYLPVATPRLPGHQAQYA